MFDTLVILISYIVETVHFPSLTYALPKRSLLHIQKIKKTSYFRLFRSEGKWLSPVRLETRFNVSRGEKTVVGTQLGILSIFNRSSGWNDCVDRVPGYVLFFLKLRVFNTITSIHFSHPHSVDALCPLPSSNPASYSTILTGSSDGLLRAVQLFPTKLIGVVEDHGDFPIERIAIDMGGEGNWVGSVGHDESLHLTDLRKVLEDLTGSDSEGEDKDSDDSDRDGEEEDDLVTKNTGNAWTGFEKSGEGSDDEEQEGDSDGSDIPVERKKRRKKEKDPLSADRKKKKRAKDEVVADPSFFSDL